MKQILFITILLTLLSCEDDANLDLAFTTDQIIDKSFTYLSGSYEGVTNVFPDILSGNIFDDGVRKIWFIDDKNYALISPDLGWGVALLPSSRGGTWEITKTGLKLTNNSEVVINWTLKSITNEELIIIEIDNDVELEYTLRRN